MRTRASCARRRWSKTSAALALTLFVRPAHVAFAQQDPRPAARAEFDEAKRLMTEGRYEAACSALESVRRLYSGPGVLLNLGDCYERVHRTASAWAAFGEAATAAASAKRKDFEAEAHRRREILEPDLSRLAIRMPEAATGLEITRDGEVVDRSLDGQAVPVDAGAHVVSLRASGRTVWSASVKVTAPGETVTVEVPDLRATAQTERAPALDLRVPPRAAAPSERRAVVPVAPEAFVPPPAMPARQLAGVSLGALGAVGLGASVALALAAESRFAAAEGESGARRAQDSDRAAGLGDGASLALVVGVSLVVNGAVLWFSGRSRPPSVATKELPLAVAF